MEAYLELGRKIVREGKWIENKRTGVRCLTIPRATLEYDVEKGEVPLITSRAYSPRIAIAELLGYIRGYDSAADFRALGTKTWDANANENKAWLANPNRKGQDDMGRVYGVQGRHWQGPSGEVDQLRKIYDDLRNSIDDRGEILTFWNPGEFDLGCLRPCLYQHHFTLIHEELFLTSAQRSVDYCLGLVSNMPQCYLLLALMAQITGHQAKTAQHNMVNVHVYENQLPAVEELLARKPEPVRPQLVINKNIETLEDLETWVTVDDFKVVNYFSQPSIKIPFTV